MSHSTVRRRSFTGYSVLFRVITALAAFIAAFVCLGQLVENRLLQVLISLAAGFVVWQGRKLWAFYQPVWRTIALDSVRKRGQTVPLVAVSVIFCALTAWGLLSNLVDPQYGVSHYAYVPVVVAAAAVAVLIPALFAGATSAAEFLASRKTLRICVLTAVFIAFFGIQVRIGYALRIPPGWDAQAVLDSAADLATGAIESLHEPYFSKYPNNIMLVLALSRYFDFVMLFGVTDLMLAAVVLNCLVLTVGAVLTYLVARRIGSEAIALFTLLPSFVFLVLSPWIMVVYSDTLGLLFPILLFYLYLVQAGLKTGPRRGLLWVAMGVTAVIGYNIKPTAIFVLLAVAAAYILAILAGSPTKKMLLTAVAATAVVVGSYASASYAITSVENASQAITFDLRDNDQAFPITHFLKMGAQANGGVYNPYYGSFHEPDVLETAFALPEERLELNLHSYLDRVKEMGTSGYLSFLSTKLSWFLGDGSFFLWGEGIVAGQPFTAEDPLSRDIQSYYGFGNENYGTLIGVWQAAWFALLGLVALPLVRPTPSLFTHSTTIMRVALLGLYVFLLFFEARARYLYLYVPFFIILASLSASVLSKRREASPLKALDQEGVPLPVQDPCH